MSSSSKKKYKLLQELYMKKRISVHPDYINIRVDRWCMEDLVYPNVSKSTIIGDWMIEHRNGLSKDEPPHIAYAVFDGRQLGYEIDLSHPFSKYPDEFYGGVRIFACNSEEQWNGEWKRIEGPLALFQQKKYGS